MALKMDFPDRTDGVCKNAYVVIDLMLSNITKTGYIRLGVWNSKSNRKAGKMMINDVRIPVVNEKEVIKNDKTVKSLSFNDFVWQDGKTVYKKMKKMIIKLHGEIIDLANSADV